MSLATRCSACGTMFRVVQDQLLVSQGWARCGRCDNVFNALEALVDLEAEPAPVAGHPDADRAGLLADTPADVDTAHADHDALPPMPPSTEREGAPWPGIGSELPAADRSEESAATASALVRPASAPGSADAADPEPITALPMVPPAAPTVGPAEARFDPPVTAPTPRFMRQAERDARWTSPAMRAALSGTVLMLLAMLLVQVVYHFRHDVAARSASAADLLRSACERWGCHIEPPRHLQDVTLESHALLRIAQQPKALRLAINLRNRGHTEMALPAVDLSLTDANGGLIARRALLPDDFRITVPVIARGAELPLELVLSAGDQNIVGYTVELFYP